MKLTAWNSKIMESTESRILRNSPSSAERHAKRHSFVEGSNPFRPILSPRTQLAAASRLTFCPRSLGGFMAFHLRYSSRDHRNGGRVNLPFGVYFLRRRSVIQRRIQERNRKAKPTLWLFCTALYVVAPMQRTFDVFLCFKEYRML